MQIRIIFTRKIFALSLVLGTQEWPIEFEVKGCSQSVVRTCCFSGWRLDEVYDSVSLQVHGREFGRGMG